MSEQPNEDEDHGLTYHHGFGNHFESEAYPGALPKGRNNPRIVPHGLYTEQLSGTAFTAPRNENRRVWLYRTQPSVVGTKSNFVACGVDVDDEDEIEKEGTWTEGSKRNIDILLSSLKKLVSIWAEEEQKKGNKIFYWNILSHKDMTALVEHCPTTVAELSSLGIPNAIIDQHGEQLVKEINSFIEENEMPRPSKKMKTDPKDCTSAIKEATQKLPETFGGADWIRDMKLDPNPMRWGATPLSSSKSFVNFLEGVQTLLGSGDPTCKAGIGVYVYACNADMSGEKRSSKLDWHAYNSDGDFLVVPQQCGLWIQTELGRMTVAPGEVCVIPRGVVFTVNIMKHGQNGNDWKFARGYILEIFRGHFQLPELGPIGSNGLANARDFLHPTAYYGSPDTTKSTPCIVINKFGQRLFARSNPHSPYNVVAWHGNYLPFKYNLHKFCAVNSVTYDHPDPSIYTVLTAKGGDEDGTALADFVIFPPRIMATDENTFRPPWFHRNIMTEFMGLIYGEYDAKKREMEGSKSSGFVPGGASLHSIMTPHGPDAESYYVNVKNSCKTPTKFEGGLAFMFESSAMCKVSKYALECGQREKGYAGCWDGLASTFPDTHAS